MLNVIRRVERLLPVAVALLSSLLPCSSTVYGQWQQSRVNTQSALKLESPIETSGELTLLRDELAREAQDLDALANWEGKQILISTGDLPSATKTIIFATSGAIFANSKDVQKISDRLGDSAEALGKALAKFQQAKLDLVSRQLARSVSETREGLAFANESKSEMADAVSQTKAIVERTTKVVTVHWDSDLAAEIAGRIWKERPEFAEAARRFAAVDNLMRQQHEVLNLEGTYRTRIAELNHQLVNQELSGGLIPPQGLIYNPDALSSSEKAARQTNEQKMAAEILGTRAPASAASQLDQATSLKSWLDGGDRSLSPSELKTFYDQYPQLRKYASVAAYRSPESEVQDDLNSGTLKLTPATPSQQAAQKVNEQKIADETLNTSSLPATLTQTPQGLIYNPDALSSSEKAARQTNEQKMAAEILGTRAPASAASQLDQATSLKSWLDGGDRSLSPSELKTFYDQYPQLRKYASVAAYRSPESEIQDDLNSGTLKLTPATPSQQAAQKVNEQKIADETLNTFSLPATLTQTPQGLIYNPDALSSSEKAARQTNEQKMAAEILGTRAPASAASQLDQATSLKSWLDGGDRSLSPSELKTFYDQYPQLRKYASVAAYRSPESEVQDDLNSGTLKLTPATPSQQAAQKVNEQKIADETLNTSSLPATLTQTPQGLIYKPDALTSSEKTARQANEQKMAAETLKGTSLSGDILDPISGTDSFGYSTSSKKSPDGRLTAVTKWSFRNAAGGGFPQSTLKWDVYDLDRFVGEYDDVNLLADGKFQVLTTPGASAIMTPDGKSRAPVFTIYDAALEIQKEQFFLANSASLQNSGYGETEAFGGGVFAGFKLGHGWDLLDSHGQNLGDGVFQQVKPLTGGAFAASKNSFGGDWEVFDASGHRLGDGTYADVEVQNGQIAAWKQLGGGSPVYLMPSPSNSVSVPIQQAPTTAVSTNSVNSRAGAQAVSSLSASQGTSILQRARQKSQDLQSRQQYLLQQLQNLDQQVRETLQRQVPPQQPAPFPAPGTRNPVTPTATCSASRSASSCGPSPNSPQPTLVVPRSVGQQTGASRSANQTPVGAKPTATPPPPPHLPPPSAPPKAPPVPRKPK